jgi:nucleoside-diphosphate-sugar epimerase
MAGEKVLVTGASGFIAKHCIAELLRQGYSVQATLRDLGREEATRRAIGNAGATASEAKFFSADLLNDAGWDKAMEGCTYVLHVASPFPIKNPKDPDEVIRPAREGAVRVLGAATKAGVKRVVLTSSIVAVTLPWPEAQPGHVFDETDWTNPDRPDVTAYVVSKTLAERAAWEFVKNTSGAAELTVVNPAFVLGPAPDADLSTSHEVIRLMGTGAYPAAPKIGFPISDVRDVALTHVLAMTNPNAAGQRFLTANGFLHLFEIGQLIKQALTGACRASWPISGSRAR